MSKKIIKNFIQTVIKLLSNLSAGRFVIEQLLTARMQIHQIVNHKEISLKFVVPNALCDYRVNSFSTKEPDTLEWIDAIPKKSVLWDIGANVGLYSVYAAKSRDARVFAFEPSVFNLELLARNIFLNQLQEQIVVLPLALSAISGPSLFRMSTTQWGGALSTFGEEYGQDGKILDNLFEYQICGMSIDNASTQLGLTLPNFIKIDVDGIEHLILSGAVAVLKQVESVLIEINDDFPQQAEQSAKLLKQAGLTLYRKCNLNAGKQFNQWWVRFSITNNAKD